MRRLVINVIGFNAGWFASVLGAANGMPWLGPVVVGAVLALHFALASGRLEEAVSIAVIACIGTGVDGALHLAGLIGFEDRLLFWPWLFGLWCNFAATLRVSFHWLVGRWWLAAILGGIGGSTTYLAGAKLGALTLAVPLFTTLGVIAIEWAVAMPLALWWVARVHRGRHAPIDGREVEHVPG